MTFIYTILAAIPLAIMASPCVAMSAEEINSADPLSASGDGAQPGIVRLQIALDRAGASTGWIDGHSGPSTQRAISAAEEMLGLPVDGQLDAELWSILQTGEPMMQTYTLTEEDVNQTLVPDFERGDWAAMRGLDCICYHSMTEALAEKFHLDEDLLKALNPDADFTAAGTQIIVPALGEDRNTPVARVVVDKGAGQVRGFDEGGKLVWAARAAVGSQSTPSPSGTVKVTAVALDPTYTYSPENFPENNIKDTFTVAAGPNGPVGSVWIDLSKPTYGLHGTPHPEELNTMVSHGCVRMTNWDAKELAHLVTAGVPVEFVD